MNAQDAQILVNAEDAVGLYASPLLSPVDSSPVHITKSKNLFKIKKKPKVPSYLRESLPKKCHRPAKNVVSALPENSERPSSYYMDSVMEKVWDKMQKRQSALKQAKMARQGMQVSVSASLNPRKSLVSSSFFVPGKQPPSRFQQYKSFFCDENIEKVRIQTSAPDRRASVRAFGKDAIIFQPRRFNQENETKGLADPPLHSAMTEQALSSVLPSVPPADVSPAILSKIESPATLYSVPPRDTKFKLNPIVSQPFQGKLDSSQGGNPSKKNEKRKQQSGILTTIQSGIPSGRYSKEELLSSRKDRLSDVLNRSNEQSMLSFLKKEHSKALSQEKENILIEPAEMFNSSVSHSRLESQASSSPYREMSRVNSNQQKVIQSQFKAFQKLRKFEQRFKHKSHNQSLRGKSTSSLNQKISRSFNVSPNSHRPLFLKAPQKFLRREENEYENEKQGAGFKSRTKKKDKPMKPERLIEEIAKKAHDFILLQKKSFR